jgi:hypothetical protein
MLRYMSECVSLYGHGIGMPERGSGKDIYGRQDEKTNPTMLEFAGKSIP